LRASLATMGRTIAADWAIHVRLVGSDEEVALDADVPRETMSAIKVAILVTLFRRAESGEANLARRIKLVPGRRRVGTGLLRLLDDGLALTVRDAAVLMIAESDNTATDVCIEEAGGVEVVNREMRTLGLPTIRLAGTTHEWFRALAARHDPAAATWSPEELWRRGYPGPPSLGGRSIASPEQIRHARETFYDSGERAFGTATARELSALVDQIAGARCAGRDACEQMRVMLEAQVDRSRVGHLAAGDAVVASKTGTFGPFVATDTGMIHAGDRHIASYAIMASGFRGMYGALEDTIARMGERIIEAARLAATA
jgi:beta-lactamase class A